MRSLRMSCNRNRNVIKYFWLAISMIDSLRFVQISTGYRSNNYYYLYRNDNNSRFVFHIHHSTMCKYTVINRMMNFLLCTHIARIL